MRADLLVLGAGAKAAAIAAKVHAINELGYGPVSVTIVEGNEPAASWLGLNGMTSGEETLAIPPIKDVGFPYESGRAFGELGDEIDEAMLSFSWAAFLIGGRRYARWVNAELPSVRHRDYGMYLAWVHSRATTGVRHVRGRVKAIAIDGGGWAVDVVTPEGERLREAGAALLLTGSGVHRELPHDPAVGGRLMHCDDHRGDLAAAIPADRRSEVAIVGGGEGALSCVLFLRQARPAARMTVHTPELPMSRGEGFLENRVFADPDSVGWAGLDLATRRDFIARCDRGVFGPDGLLQIAYDDHLRFVTGRVTRVGPDPDHRGVRLESATSDGQRADRYDFVVNCTGFDVLAQVRELFGEDVRAAMEAQAGPVFGARGRDEELRFGRGLEIAGLEPRLHIPGLANLSQGPGFANLGCLGLMADRVLAPVLHGAERGAQDATISATSTTAAT
ncbi:SidA/IucD/PvdA family monooxygenase [Baekduia sp. Peel2402]|uniref:SidA/IucD/PvdA family monooxygenase n=1 Tax=Baekduia sp. Peel2402 TaxID=3458296 RepID=UPI00403E7E14